VLLPALVAGLCLYMQWMTPDIQAVVVMMVNPVARLLSIILAAGWCLTLGFRAVCSISRERELRTLEALFLLPVERKEILWAKWLGSILRYQQIGYALAIVWMVGFCTGSLHAWAVLLLAASTAIYLALVASLGILLSLVSRNTLWANLSMALLLMILFIAPWLGAATYEQANPLQPSEASWQSGLLEISLNPVRALWYVGFSWGELADGIRNEDPLLPSMHIFREQGPPIRTTIGGVLLGLLALGLAAWLFWLIACWRFRRELDRKSTRR
jgi:ABC-type transport system involved in multi-copper enzyme maturation permease subunit